MLYIWFPKFNLAKESPEGPVSHPKPPLQQAACTHNKEMNSFYMGSNPDNAQITQAFELCRQLMPE